MTCSSRLAVIATALLGMSATAARGADRFTRVSGDDAASLQSFKPVFLPLGAGARTVTVIVEVAGDPVAVRSARANAPLSRAEKEAVKSSLRQVQAPVEDAVRARGGAVLGRYQSAYNGVKVRIAADRARELLSVPGVVALHPVRIYRPDNTHGVPLVGAPAVWGGVPGLHGEGVKIAVIDTGIDYTHADFGGPGTPAAYDAAHKAETAPADPAFFGPNAPKVKGGIDLVGDSYNADPTSASYQPIPHPDPNPLDCFGHGSHVAGTAAGFGVLSTGATYTGPYDASTIATHAWNVGPGVAPKADLYAVRVFGCEGSTDVVADAIDWAVDHDMDVINMSLGSAFGTGDDPDAVAATNAARAGIIVVASAGNAGPVPYLVGAPSTGDGAVSVAASDPTESFPGADVALSTTTLVPRAIDANGVTFADGTTLPVVVLMTGTNISLGCDPAEYTKAGVTGKLVVTRRGTCARVARAIFGQKAGAAAVLMLNNAPGYPPYEGPITSNPDTGEAYTVTIPFLGVPLTTANRNALLGANGATATLTNVTIANPGFRAVASFSSGGPRSGDSALKPEVTAPGVSIFSVAIGTGNLSTAMSGTSMAAPHTSGVAALVRQAHPQWKRTELWKAALVNTAAPAGVTGYEARLAGAGLVQAPPAVGTRVVATGVDGGPVLNFGFAELSGDFSARQEVKLRNLGDATATFDVGVALGAGSAHTVTPSRTRVEVRPHAEAPVGITLAVPAATAGDSSAFSDVSGVVSFTPVGGSNGGVALRVPYYLVPQALSDVRTKLDVDDLVRTGSAVATTTNPKGVIAGNADWYAWGLSGRRNPGFGPADLRAVGVQSFPADGVLAFAVSTWNRWSNPSQTEIDLPIDVDGDGTTDYVVVAADLGALTAGSNNGQYAVAVFTGDFKVASIQFLADAPFDSSTAVLPVLFSQLCVKGYPCLSANTNPRFTYAAFSFGWTGLNDALPGPASFNAFAPAVSTGMFDTVPPGGSATETVTVNRTELARTPALGFMIVTHDNPSVGNPSEAQLISLFGD